MSKEDAKEFALFIANAACAALARSSGLGFSPIASFEEMETLNRDCLAGRYLKPFQDSSKGNEQQEAEIFHLVMRLAEIVPKALSSCQQADSRYQDLLSTPDA